MDARPLKAARFAPNTWLIHAMRFLLKVVFSLIIFVVFAFGALTWLVPTETVRDQITAIVKDQTGRELTVGGETSFSFYPNIGVRLGDVALSNPPGVEGGPLVRMKALELGLKLTPLVTGDVEVQRFVLEGPVFDLRVDATGRKNWEFKKLGGLLDGTTKTAAASPQPRYARAQTAGGVSMLRDVRLGDVRIEDGTVLFTDEITGIQEQLSSINVTVAMERLSEPLSATGDLVWQGEKIDFDGQVNAVNQLTGDKGTPVKVTLKSGLVTGTFDGEARLGEAPVVVGALDMDTPSVRDLAYWLGSDVPAGGFGKATIKGDVRATDQKITFKKAQLTLDGMTGQGEASVLLTGQKPYIQAAMAFDKIDLNPFLNAKPGKARQRTTRVRKTTSTAVKGTQPRPDADDSLTDFIEKLNKEDTGRPPKQVRGWSQTAFNFAGLAAVDADVNLTTKQLLYRQIKVGRSAVTANLKRGVLTADLNDMRLYEGRGTGRLKLNGASRVPQLAVRLNLERVQALPVLKDAMKFDWLSGRADLAVSLAGAGRSESELVRSLQGKGNLSFTDGAIEGINIPKMVRGLKRGQFSGWKRLASEKTDFSSLTGTFTMKKGVATNPDLRLIGPLVRLAAAGTVALPQERVDYNVEPRIVASLEGQGTDDGKSGLLVPLRVHGHWDRPNVTPDLKRLLENPDQAIDTVKKLGDAVKKLKKNKNFGNVLQNFLGQQGNQQQPADGNPTGTTQDQPQGQSPQDALRQLFRQ